MTTCLLCAFIANENSVPEPEPEPAPLTPLTTLTTQETPSATKLNRDQTVGVDPGYYWRPIGSDAPRGVKLQLLGKGCVASYGVLGTRLDGYWTHYAPLPTLRKE